MYWCEGVQNSRDQTLCPPTAAGSAGSSQPSEYVGTGLSRVIRRNGAGEFLIGLLRSHACAVDQKGSIPIREKLHMLGSYQLRLQVLLSVGAKCSAVVRPTWQDCWHRF